MIFLYILLGILFLLVLLLFLPIRLHIRIKDGQTVLQIHIALIRFRLYPDASKRETRTSRKNGRSKPAEKKKRPINLSSMGTFLSRSMRYVPRSFQSINVPRFCLKADIHGADAATTAQVYGYICAGFGLLWNPLTQLFSIQNPMISITPDFEGEKTVFYFNCIVSTSLFRLIGAALPILIAYYRMKHSSLAGGAQNGK